MTVAQHWLIIKCDDTPAMLAAEEAGDIYICQHICGDVWDHMARMEHEDEERLARALEEPR